MARYYDVVVLGRSLGALAAAALLARRDFRVLLLGQAQKPATYVFEGKLFARRAFTLLTGTSPAWRRILQELAQSPRFRRRTLPLDPMFAVLAAGRRVEVPPDVALFGREVDREFPEVRQLVDELYASFAQVNAAADAAFERDAVWPPGNFWERLETARVAASLPFVDAQSEHDLLGKFPVGHFFRELVALPATFATDLASTMPAFALARLHGAWTRGVFMLARGEDEIADFLVERIEAHGGECRLGERASSLIVRHGTVSGVLVDGEDEPTGASAVVTDLAGESVAELSGGEGITKSARRDWPRLSAAGGRFVVCVLVRRAGLPAPLPVESFLVPARGARPDPRRPTVHLQRLDPAEHAATDEQAASCDLLVAEALLPKRGPLTLLEAREAVLATLREHLPFLDAHVIAIDSPHDGLPLDDRSRGARREIDRIHVGGAAPGAEPMERLWTVDPPGYLGLAGEPIRGPIVGTYLVR
jgi:hypothetical protein